MLNIRSLPKHIDEVRILLANQCIDVLALNETRLDDSISNQDLFIQSYDLIRVDRSREGGGICLYVRNSLNYLERKDLLKDNFEAVCIEICKPSTSSFIVSTIYRPPSALVDTFAKIEQLVKTTDDENKEFYLLGDLNANVLDVSNNATKNLNSIIELYQLSQTISSPTRVTLNSSSLVDVCLTPTPDKLILSRVVKTTISNHYMILIVRKINIIPKLNRYKKIEVCNFKHFNANNFQTDLHNQTWELISNYSDVDRMWDIWKTLFMDVLDRHAPLREKRVKNKPNVPWLTSEIKLQIRKQDNLKRLAIKFSSDDYWDPYKISRNKTTDVLHKAKANYYKRQFVNVKDDPKKAWKTVNKILNREKKSSDINCINYETHQISNPNELAECFNNYFTNIGPEIAHSIDSSDVNFRDKYIK